ncbi:DUF1853 family protein [Salinimicrobium sp. CDJ15-81-2]|nr:DUF1853 family protein [Salinimicrobium nanhaiense]
MEFSLKEQFEGFLSTPQIFAENDIFEYPLYPAFHVAKAKELPDIDAPGASVLGKRMEHYFATYISHFTSEEVLAYNRQIIQDKLTLGELDFLLKDRASGAISHTELVYKFYLYDPASGSSELEHLIGPNKRDSLNKKLHRLQKRQFPLLFHEATRNLLNELKISPEEVVQKMCFKASVFLPKQMDHIAFRKINHDTISGYWIKAAEFTSEAYQENGFFIPDKIFWRVNPERNTKWFSIKEIQPQLNRLLQNKFSPLLWMKTPTGQVVRFFVVWW